MWYKLAYVGSINLGDVGKMIAAIVLLFITQSIATQPQFITVSELIEAHLGKKRHKKIYKANRVKKATATNKYGGDVYTSTIDDQKSPESTR